MNTSANTNRNHDNTSPSGSGLLRRGMAAAVLATAITAIGVGLAATGHADDAPGPDFANSARLSTNCKTEPWGFLGSQRRTLCDSPVSSDGSWRRERTIWVPAHHTPYHCNNYGSSRSYTTCYGGDFVDQQLISNETYPVRPDTVLPEEPGHLG
jgi:hypothetical protein